MGMKMTVITIWPAAMRLELAAQYSGLSVETFKNVCPIKPITFTQSSRGDRYLKLRLDEWLELLDPNSPRSSIRRFGDKLGAQSEAKGA
jgi:hypothetical protein